MKRIIRFLFTFIVLSSMLFTTVFSYVSAQTDTGEEAGASAPSAQTAGTETSELSTQAAGAESSDPGDDSDSSSAFGTNHLKGAPDVTAESAILMDASTGAVLYSKESETKRYPASITKVMTALLAIENCSLDDIVTFSSEAVNSIEEGSSSAGINAGAKLTVRDTLYALMLVSANEAGAALAEHIGGSQKEFAKMMNERAKELGCTGTHFNNPHGLPDENHYTTAHDMALILKKAVEYKAFRTIASADTYTLKKSDTLTDTLELWNHSKILRENSDYYYKEAVLSKPGFTNAALNTLVTYAKKRNVKLLCVVLKDHGANNSYYDTKNLFQWGFSQVKGIKPLSEFNFDAALAKNTSISAKKRESIKDMKITFNSDYYILVPKDLDPDSIKTAFVLDEDGPAQILGYINISSGDTVIGSAPVYYKILDSLTNTANTDDLQTAPISEDTFTPHKLLEYLVRIAIAIILIYLIMNFIRRRQAEKRRKQRILNRKKRGSQSNSTRSSSSRRRPPQKRR